MNKPTNTTPQTSESGQSIQAQPEDPDPLSAEPTPSPIAIDVSYAESISIDDAILTHLKKHLQQVCVIEEISSGQISLYLTDDDEMSQLHVERTGISGTTDILTFDLRDDIDNHDIVDVDIVLCIDEAKRQAKRYQHKLQDELLLYAVHGVLHVQGYDDHEAGDFAKMHQREDEILKQLGIDARFHAKGVNDGD